MKIVFAKTRYLYQSYVDLWQLVELSGFPTCYVDEIDLEDEGLFIISPVNGELRPHVTHRRSILKGPQRAKLVFLNLERPDSGLWRLEDIGNGASNELDEIMKYVDFVWSMDRWYASLDRRMIHVTMGSHPGMMLGPMIPSTANYDLCHMSYAVGRRDEIYGKLKRNFRLAPNGWGAERHALLQGSRAMVNVHQTPAPLAEPLRIAVAAAYAKPLLSETIQDPYPLVPGEHFLQASHADLNERIIQWMADENTLSRIGANLYTLLCFEHTFEKGIRDAAKRTLERV